MNLRARIALLACLIAMQGCTYAAVRSTAPKAEASQIVTQDTIDPASGKVTGRVTTTTTGSAVGTAASAIGDKVSDQLKSDPAAVNVGGLTATSGISSTGGGVDRDTTAKGDQSIWIMLACLLAGAVCLAMGIKQLVPPSTNVRGGIGFAVAGAALITVAFYPAILLWALAGIVAAGIGLYYVSETRAAKGTEASRAALAAIGDLPDDVKSMAIAAFQRHASEDDRKEYLRVSAKDNLPLPPI